MKKTAILIVILLIVATILVVIAVQPTPKKQVVEIVPTSPPASVADTSLSLSPNPVQLSSGQSSVDVLIDSGKNNVTAVQLEIAYDPKILTNVTVKSAAFLPSPVQLLNRNDENNGRISFAVGLAPMQDPVTGTGTVATITFEKNPSAPASATSTELTLLDKSLVTMVGEQKSVLKHVQGATVNISAD